MHLMTQKSAKSISVRELAEQADINRSTFYIHYRDVNDLLLHLEDEMAGVCQSSVGGTIPRTP